MDEAALFTLLKSTGLSVAYHHFTTPPTPPYLVYLFAYSDNFAADNKVYVKGSNYQVELYTTKKDPASEKKVEDVLDLADVYYDKSETFIDKESLYQVLYEIGI